MMKYPGYREHYSELRSFKTDSIRAVEAGHNKLFFLSMASCTGTVPNLKSENIVDGKGFEHLIVEKPFGTDLATASQQRRTLGSLWWKNRFSWPLPRQEMIQSIFIYSFCQSLFENIWNRDYWQCPDYFAQLGVERTLAYDQSGAFYEIWCRILTLQLLVTLSYGQAEKLQQRGHSGEKVKVFWAAVRPDKRDLKRFFIRGRYSL